MEKIPLIVVVGPTAVGKTALSIKLAKYFNCEIISIDSVQVYKKFDIGSAKIKKEEMEGITHHLIDILNPEENFSVYDFQKLARQKIAEVHHKNKIPLLIGGTGYYMNAVINDYKFSDYKEAKEDITVEEMKEFLKEHDFITYSNIDLSNERRVINAYNYYQSEKKSFSKNQEGNNILSEYNPYLIAVDMPREKLYERINMRVEVMIKMGLINEVREILKDYGENLQPLGAIGYKEVVQYLKSEVSLEDMTNNIQQNSRRYAKRQLTWFRNKMNPNWYKLEEYDRIILDIEKFIKDNSYADN